MFERNGNFLEAGQCLEVIADYSEAVEVLLRGKLYSRAIEVSRRFNQLTSKEQKLTSPPRRTLDELYLTSAEFHFRGGNKTEMSASLQHVKSLNARVDFLKKQRLFQDAAEELHKEGRSAEAANVMRENGSFLLAADYAKSSGNSSLAADCIFAYVRSETSMPKEEQDNHLEEAKELYKETGKMNSFGEVLLQQAKLTQDQSKVLEAIKIFSKSSISNTCGELECVEFLRETVGDDDITGLINNWTLVKLVKNVLDLILSLNVHDPNFEAQKKIDKCEEYFGLSTGEDDTKRVVRHKEGVRFLLISRELEKLPLAGSKWEMVLQHVRARIGENLFQRIASLIPQIRSFLIEAISSNETCQHFLVGIPCDHGGSHCQHSLPSDKRTEALFWAISHTIYLDAQANDFFKLGQRYMPHQTIPGGAFQRRLSSSSTELKHPFPNTSFEFCIKLLNFFFPPMGVSPTIRLEEYIRRVRTTNFLKKSLYKFAEELWKRRSIREERISDVNLFMRVSNLLQLIGSPPMTILSWIEEEEKDFLNTHDSQTSMPRVAQSGGMVLEGNPRRWTLFARWWEDSKRMLHANGRILDAGHYAVRRFLKMTASPKRKLPFPSPRNFLAILEYHMCVHLALAACVFGFHRIKLRVCLPRSYLSVVTFWDALNCSLTNHFRTYHAVEMSPPFPKTIRAVQKFLGDMASIMLGGCSSKFNVLDKVLRTSDCIESGEAERAVILVLTMLCNCGQSFPPESESILLRNLCANISDKVVLPQRVKSCLEQVRQATGIRQLVVILQDLLSSKQEELCDVHWRSSRGRLWRDDVDPSAYIETFNTDVLENLSQETPEIPPEDVSEPEAEEYGPHVEHEGLMSDLDPERSEAIKREEALQAKSWKEEMIPEERDSAEMNSGEVNTEDNVPLRFGNVKVDESGCGICNVIFTSKEQPVSESFSEQANASGYTDDFVKDRDSHLTQNSPHWKKQRQFENYKVLFMKEVSPVVSKVKTLVGKAEDHLKMADQQDMSVSSLSYRLNEVKTARSSLIEVTARIEKECKWEEEKSLKEATASLTRAYEACQQEVRNQNAREEEGWYLFSAFSKVKK